jgi:hypothetical protein
MSFYFNPKFLEQYSVIDKAENYELFSEISSCVYFWYFPINFKSQASSFFDILSDFQKKESKVFSEVHSLELIDTRQKYRSKITGIELGELQTLNIPNEDSTFYKKFRETFLLLSLYNKPIYIGKSTRPDSSMSRRIKEHLTRQTDFSKKLNQILTEQDSNLTLGDMLVRVLDVEKLRSDHFDPYVSPDLDLALFIEKILINLYKPKFNIIQ